MTKQIVLVSVLCVLSLIYTLHSSNHVLSTAWVNEASSWSMSAPLLQDTLSQISQDIVVEPVVKLNSTDLEMETVEDSRFPQKSLGILPPSMNDKKILVAYSGPTELISADVTPETITSPEKKMELYRLNFEFFLKHGIQCQSHDTLLVVTQQVAAKYQSQIANLNAQCHQDFGHFVRLVLRNSTCLDLESVRVALLFAEQIGRPAVFSNKQRNDKTLTAYYDYFVYMNCGVTGPSLEWAKLPWINVFLQGLHDKVKMTGLTMNCGANAPHIQSMLYAIDREGLQIVMDGGAIYDCTERGDHLIKDKVHFHGSIVNGYERRMGHLLLQAGYGISSVLRPTTLFQHNRTRCLNKFGNESLDDIWIGDPMTDYFGKIPTLDEVIFFKTSRILTPEIAHVINFSMVVDWNWI